MYNVRPPAANLEISECSDLKQTLCLQASNAHLPIDDLLQKQPFAALYYAQEVFQHGK